MLCLCTIGQKSLWDYSSCCSYYNAQHLLSTFHVCQDLGNEVLPHGLPHLICLKLILFLVFVENQKIEGKCTNLCLIKKIYGCWVHYFQYCSYSMSNTKIHILRYLYILAYNNTICIMYSFYSAARMMKACSIRKLPSISHFIMCWITILATSLLTTHTYQLYQLIISMCLIHFMQNQLQLGLMPKFLNGKYYQMPSHPPWYVPHTYIHHLLPLPQRRFRIRQASLPSILLLLWSLHLFLPLNQQWTL